MFFTIFVKIIVTIIKAMYKYKWKPNASQRREFAEKMQDPEEKAAYEQRKIDKKLYDSQNNLK